MGQSLSDKSAKSNESLMRLPWGANPAVLLKYSRTIGKFDVTGIYHEDIDKASNIVSSIAIPLPQTRRVALHVKREFGSFGIEVGGIWGGEPLNGRKFQIAEINDEWLSSTDKSGPKYTIYTDKINSEDNWGGKAKITIF